MTRGPRRASYSRKQNGRWCVRWRSPFTGSQRQHSCPDVATARRVCREVEDALCRGEDWSASRGKAGHVALLLAEYINDLERTRTPNTITRLESFAEDLVRWAKQRDRKRGPLPLELLTAELVTDYDRALLNRGNAVRTRRAKVGFILNAWRWGLGREAFGDRLGPVPTIEMPDPVDAAPKAPTWALCDTAIDAMQRRRNQEPFVRRVAMACRFLGLRPVQAAHLRRDHIDTSARTLTITHDLPGTKTPQERRGRTVPYAPAFHSIALRWLAASDDHYLLPGSPARAFDQGAARRAWARAGVSPELWQGQPLKAFRKAFETELIAAGADYLAVERLVGHAIPGAGASYVDSRAFLEQTTAAVKLIPEFGKAGGTVVPLRRSRVR